MYRPPSPSSLLRHVHRLGCPSQRRRGRFHAPRSRSAGSSPRRGAPSGAAPQRATRPCLRRSGRSPPCARGGPPTESSPFHPNSLTHFPSKSPTRARTGEGNDEPDDEEGRHPFAIHILPDAQDDEGDPEGEQRERRRPHQAHERDARERRDEGVHAGRVGVQLRLGHRLRCAHGTVLIRSRACACAHTPLCPHLPTATSNRTGYWANAGASRNCAVNCIRRQRRKFAATGKVTTSSPPGTAPPCGTKAAPRSHTEPFVHNAGRRIHEDGSRVPRSHCSCERKRRGRARRRRRRGCRCGCHVPSPPRPATPCCPIPPHLPLQHRPRTSTERRRAHPGRGGDGRRARVSAPRNPAPSPTVRLAAPLRTGTGGGVEGGNETNVRC